MRNRAHDLASYSFAAGEEVLLDTNVWLFLYAAPSSPDPPFARKYSGAFHAMLSVGARIALDPLVLSEYINRYCRIQWRALHQSSYAEFKVFRRSADFSKVGPAAVADAMRIASHSTLHDHRFSHIDMASLLADVGTGAMDVADALLVEQCRLNNWKLLTDDGDCTAGGIEVLTSNPKLLKACAAQ